jgi:hypothetical protein
MKQITWFSASKAETSCITFPREEPIAESFLKNGAARIANICALPEGHEKLTSTLTIQRPHSRHLLSSQCIVCLKYYDKLSSIEFPESCSRYVTPLKAP